jgi:Holliday junction DNA helicase RuvA
MIALLKGTVVHREPNRAIVEVRGVGYEVFAPNRAIEAWATATDDAVVHVATVVREDAIQLYGFGTAAERAAFGVLQSVSGIGPKLALACLDAFPVESLARAVDSDDVGLLSRVPGVGKKTAQRLALELKGKLPPAGAGGGPVTSPPQGRPADDTFGLALLRLGYTRAEIERARSGIAREGVADDASMEDKLRAALRVLYGASP